jgi:hypothetical protein
VLIDRIQPAPARVQQSASITTNLLPERFGQPPSRSRQPRADLPRRGGLLEALCRLVVSPGVVGDAAMK